MSILDMRGVKFSVTATYPPEQQKILEDKLHEAMKARGLPTGGPVMHEVKVFTLDEALDYFQTLKRFQDVVEENERSHFTPTDAN